MNSSPFARPSIVCGRSGLVAAIYPACLWATKPWP